MSKSYRKPYSSPTGNLSAKKDKQIANRALRRKQNNYIKMNWNEETFLIPHKYECSHNEVWGWSRDGIQRYQRLNRSWNEYCLIMQGCWIGYYNFDDQVWPPIWYSRLVRK